MMMNLGGPERKETAKPTSMIISLKNPPTMASLPKKSGGSRTIAIAATLYRLLMQLDNEPVAQFELEKAFVSNSAKAGASAIHAAKDRALQAEIAQYKKKKTINMLWDVNKFFDSISICILIKEAIEVGFPMQQLALSLSRDSPCTATFTTWHSRGPSHLWVRAIYIGWLQTIYELRESIHNLHGPSPARQINGIQAVTTC